MAVCFPYHKSTTTTSMRPSIWSKTPDHILEHILAYLPMEDLIRMRGVCKAWSVDILTVSTFRALHKNSSPTQEPWFLVSTRKRSFSAYNADTHKWNILCRPNLPDPDLRVLASSQGLVCYGFSEGEDVTITDFYMCNPITGDWRHLPCHPETTVDHFGIHYDEATRSYKVLTMNVSTTGFGIRRVTIYDSLVEKWTDTPVPRSDVHFSKSPMVWCNNYVYFMDKIYPSCEIHALNLEQSTWHELETIVPQLFEYPMLVACKERLFMVGLRLDGCKIFEVFDLGAGGLELVEYDTLPKLVPNECAVKKKTTIGYGRCTNYNSFRLNAVGSSSKLMGFSSNLDQSWVLVYDTERKCFRESVKDVNHTALLTDNVGLSFRPCLDSSP